jgi:nucleoid-associated protein YgaU
MNRHVGASFTLSFSVVGFFAIILYQPEDSPVSTAQPPSVARSSPDGSPTSVPDPAVRPTSARETADQAAPRPVFTASAKAQVTPRQNGLLRPRSAFTEVAEGESLADVATRIYGAPEAARTLWHANRDMIGSFDAPLQVGMFLRTP